MKLSFVAMNMIVSVSIRDPLAISKKRLLSVTDFREELSAIFKCTDNEALRICCDITNLSSVGNSRVSR